MKNILTILVTVVALFLMSCGNDGTSTTASAAANTTATKPKTTTPKANTPKTPTTKGKVGIKAKNVSVKSGAEVCVTVQVSNFNEILSMQYGTSWDPKALKFKTPKNISLEALTNNNFGKTDIANGLLRVSWYHPNLKDVSLMDNSTIYQLCFDAIGKSGTSTEVRFGDKRMITEIVNKRNQFFKLDSKPAIVTIE